MAKLPYRLILRETDHGAVWYARYTDPRTGRRNCFSTHVGGNEDKGRAYTAAAMKIVEIKEGYTKCSRLEDFAAGFFEWDAEMGAICPWIKRQHAKGRDFGEYQAQTRSHLKNHILPQFGERRLDELK